MKKVKVVPHWKSEYSLIKAKNDRADRINFLLSVFALVVLTATLLFIPAFIRF